MNDSIIAAVETPPAVEPVALEEAKTWLKVDSNAEDALIASLILAARQSVERMAGLALIERRLTVTLDRWPPRPDIVLPVWPVSAILELRIAGEDGEALTVDPAHYVLEGTGRPARIVRRAGRTWPEPGRDRGGILISLTAGFGTSPADVPEPLCQAIRTLLAAWYESREQGVLASVKPLLLPYMELRLQ